MTWSCHVCGDERPDEAIAVLSRRYRSAKTGVEMQENVRYCRDRPGCEAGAYAVRFVADRDWQELRS